MTFGAILKIAVEEVGALPLCRIVLILPGKSGKMRSPENEIT